LCNRHYRTHLLKADPLQAAKRRSSGHRRRTRKQSNGVFLITPRDLRRVYSAPCWKCGAGGNTTFDHVIPIARGGRHSAGNSLALCEPCNKSKGAKLLVEWRYQ
jgi:5-methylcytosine-specific restriction endonuclease McrA